MPADTVPDAKLQVEHLLGRKVDTQEELMPWIVAVTKSPLGETPKWTINDVLEHVKKTQMPKPMIRDKSKNPPRIVLGTEDSES